MKIYFISDIHLGAGSLKNNKEREVLFVSWLDEIKKDADQLYLLGDIFDFWFEYKNVVPRGFTRVLGKIAEIADAGIPVHYFTGNHDLWVFDYLPEELGIMIHRELFKTEIAGKTFLMGHGDGMDPRDKMYNFLKKIFTSKSAQWMFARLHPNFAVSLAHFWSKKSRLKNGHTESRGKEEPLYKFSDNYLQKEHIDFFIFGHRHIMMDLPVGKQSRIINLGDWIKEYSFAVFNGEDLMLKKYIKQ